jgi:hypothetical protein
VETNAEHVGKMPPLSDFVHLPPIKVTAVHGDGLAGWLPDRPGRDLGSVFWRARASGVVFYPQG